MIGITILLMVTVILLIITAKAAKAQAEDIDGWYGKPMKNLLIVLQRDYDQYRVDTLSEKKIRITMVDQRGIIVEYISLDGGINVTYRVDRHRKQDYLARKLVIQNTWVYDNGEYILNNHVVASFDDENYRIGFIPKYAIREQEETDSVINM